MHPEDDLDTRKGLLPDEDGVGQLVGHLIERAPFVFVVREEAAVEGVIHYDIVISAAAAALFRRTPPQAAPVEFLLCARLAELVAKFGIPLGKPARLGNQGQVVVIQHGFQRLKLLQVALRDVVVVKRDGLGMLLDESPLVTILGEGSPDMLDWHRPGVLSPIPNLRLGGDGRAFRLGQRLGKGDQRLAEYLFRGAGQRDPLT